MHQRIFGYSRKQYKSSRRSLFDSESRHYIELFLCELLCSGHGFPNLHTDGMTHWRRNGVANLPMFFDHGPVELEVIRKALRASTFSDGNEPVLLGMQNATLLAHRLRVSYRRGEVPVPVDPTIQTGPLVMAIAGMGKAPWDESVGLLVHGVTFLLL